MSDLLTLAEVCQRLRISEQTVRAMLRAGKIASCRLGKRGQWRVRRSALENFLDGGVRGGRDGTGEVEQQPA